MGLAGRQARAKAVRLRRRSVCRWPAPRDRHRSSHGLGRPFRRAWGRRVRRTTASAGPLPDCQNRGRLVGHARPVGLDRVARRDSGQRGRRRRHGRPERGARGDGAVCPSGHPPHGGSQRLRRSAVCSCFPERAPEQVPPVQQTSQVQPPAPPVGALADGRSRSAPRLLASGRGESTCPATISLPRRGARQRQRLRARCRSSGPTPRRPGNTTRHASLSRGARAVRFLSSSARRSCGAPDTSNGSRRNVSLTWTRTASRSHLRSRPWKRGRVARGGSCRSRSAWSASHSWRSAWPVGAAGSRSSRLGLSQPPLREMSTTEPAPEERLPEPSTTAHSRRRRLAVRERPATSGYVAGFGVPSDISARYHRLRGDEASMVSGTDEHGTPMMPPPTGRVCRRGSLQTASAA